MSARAAPSPLERLGARGSPLFSLLPPQLTAPARADSTPPPAPPPSVPPARALLLLPVPGDAHARQPGSRPLAFLRPARPPPLPPRGASSRCDLRDPPRHCGPSPPPANGGSPASQSPSLPALSGGGPAAASSPSLPPNSPSGRCHHVEASAATTDVPAPAAAPHATGRGPPASRGHQPSQRWPPGSPGLLGSPRTSRCRFPLPGACVCCRERAPPGSRGHLGAAAAVTAAATPGEARGSGHRQRQGTKHWEGTPTVTGI